MKTAVYGRTAAPLKDNEVAMEIDEAGFGKLMGTLAGLYVDPPTAVLREYTSNAFDSHAKAGVERPIEVRYPTPATWQTPAGTGPLQLTVEDFGVGMDLDDLKNIYRKYGASTKAESNREIGGFGLGAKSALSITSTFTVRARKNGREVTATITKGVDGVGVLAFSPERVTKKPNGVLVTIPLNAGHRDAIHAAAGRFGHFFIGARPGSILINGEAPDTVRSNANYLAVTSASETVAWVQTYSTFDPSSEGNLNKHWTNRVTFLVGGVRYPAEAAMFKNVHLDDSRWWDRISNRLSGMLADMHRIYVNLPIGAVDLAPNREKIQLSDRSAKAVRDTFNAIFELTPKVFSSAANKINDRDAAFEFMAQNWRMFVSAKSQYADKQEYAADFLQEGSLSWRGIAVPRHAVLASEGWHEINAATGVNIAHDRPAALKINILQDFVSMRQRRQPNKRIIVTAPTVGDEQIKTVRALLRTYGEAKWQQRSMFAYLLSEKALPEALTNIYHTVSIDQFEKVAKDWRRVQLAKIEKVVKPLTFPKLVSSGSKVVAELVPAGDSSIASGTYFSVHDARIKNVKRGEVHAAFSSVRSTDPKVLTREWGLSVTAARVRDYANGSAVFLIGTNRNLKVVDKHFDSSQNLLWQVYRDAEHRLARTDANQLAALVDVGFILAGVRDSVYDNPSARDNKYSYKVQFGMLAQHGANLRSERLRHALNYMANGSESDLAFARIAGMIDWTRFAPQAAGSKRHDELMECLMDQGHSRMYGWFSAVQKVKRDNAANVAFLLDALATHHNWA